MNLRMRETEVGGSEKFRSRFRGLARCIACLFQGLVVVSSAGSDFPSF